MATRKNLEMLVAGLAAGVLAAGSAHAQTAAADVSGATTRDDGDIEEVVVTALRRSESILKAPAAITAIAGDELTTRGVNSVVDLVNLVPGLTIQQSPNGVTIGIRGVQTTDVSAKGEEDVAFNIDGAYYGRGIERNVAMFDLERVEVLRGPQGTLYGRSSTGGAVNLITVKPQLDAIGGYAKAEWGNYNTRRTEGAFNLPLISDTLAFRISGATNNRDGYAKPIDYDATIGGTTYHISALGQKAKNDQDDATLRSSLLFKPGDFFSARVTATVGNQLGTGPGSQVDDFLTSGKDQLRVFANPVPAWRDEHFANYDADINFKVGSAAQIDLIASKQTTRMFNQNTDDQNILSDGGVFGFSDSVNEFYTKQYEARISNANDGPIDYVAGANYYFEDLYENGRIWTSPIATPSDPTTYTHAFEVNNRTYHKASGLFGQATWHFNDQLSVLGGVRYTKDETQRIGYIAPPVPFFDCANTPGWYPKPCFPSYATGLFPDDGGTKDNKVTWRLGVNYQATPDALFYGAIATGFKGGGFNDYEPASTNASHTGAYGPSSLTEYELGYKGHPFQKLTISSDVFYYDFSKDQITGLTDFPESGQKIIYTIATPVTIYGWENEISYQLAHKTTLSGTASYQHSKFTNYLAGGIYGDQINWSGQSLDQTPKFVATAALEHAFELNNGAELRFRGAIKYSESYLLSDFGNAVRYTQPSFTRSDATITYAAPEDKYTVQLFVQDIENKVQRTGGINNYNCPYGGQGGECQVNNVPVYPVPGNGQVANQPYGYVNFTTSTPRFFGLRMSVKF